MPKHKLEPHIQTGNSGYKEMPKEKQKHKDAPWTNHAYVDPKHTQGEKK